MNTKNNNIKNLQTQKKSDYYSQLQALTNDEPINSLLNEDKQYLDLNKYNGFNGSKFYEIGESNIKFTDVVLTKSIKIQINDLIDEYQYKNNIKEYGFACDNKIIFHGPSGCGKTLTALALANLLKKQIYIINLSTVVSSSLGKTSNNLFEIVEDAKANKAIIFFDEFDALSKMREDINDHGEMKRVTSSLLQILDFLDEDTIIIAATNYLELIDSAIVRRFNRKILFDFPDKRNILTYLKKLVKLSRLRCAPKLLMMLAEEFKGLSYAETRDQFLNKLKKYIILHAKDGKTKITGINKDILNIKNF